MNAVEDVENFATMVDERPEEFRVSTAAYRGPQTFAAEMDRIFGKTWIYLCHESEVEKPGDFKSTQIGTRPVIVGKDRDGQVYAVLNACTHRGATLVREEKGNTRAFVCPYHGWSFRPSGELIGIPDEARYPKCFQKADKHLKRVPKIASYGGLFFGSFNEQVESLEDFLGGAKQHIDLWLKRTAGTGRAILAFSEVTHAELKSYIKGTELKLNDLVKELELTKQRGYATSRNELISGAVAVAVPFFNSQGSVAGSIGVFGPEVRLDDQVIEQILKPLTNESKNLSVLLGHKT